MIFGIFGKFWIDIGEEKKSKNIFRRQKLFSTKHFEDVFSKKMSLFEENFSKNLKIEIFENFKILKILTFLKFRNFQNFNFQKIKNFRFFEIFIFFILKIIWWKCFLTYINSTNHQDSKNHT